MSKSFGVFPLVIVLLAAGCAEESATEQTAEESARSNDPCPSLVGSWELVRINEEAGALTGEYESDPDYQEAPTLKILNDTHWMFIRQSAGEFVHAQGGNYTLEAGGFYTEHVAFSAITQNVGARFTFECRLEGDSLWHHQSLDGLYDEVWRRVR